MKIAIEGMHSPGCLRRVRVALQKVEGLRVGELTLGSAVVNGDVKQQAAAIAAIEKAGYQPHILA